MAKRADSFDLALPSRTVGTSAHRWLYTALRGEILAGRLRPGARIPATRDLARQYKLARGTVVNAFDQLKSEGYLTGTVGSGTRVNRVLPDDLLHIRAHSTESSPPAQSQQPRLSAYGKRVRLFSNFEPRPARAFRTNMPALDLFPMHIWTQLSARRLRRASVQLLLACEPLGHSPLRQAIADYLNASRGTHCTAEQIAIVSGTQEALDLTARLLLNPGDRVAIEDPGYSGASIAFAAAGAKLAPISLDSEGFDLRDRSLRGAKLAYVTPGHQFPLGMTMSLPRRLALIEWARRTDALVFEDDYDSEFRYAGRPVPALQGLDRHGCVIFAGTFSKVLFPALRLAYVIVPPALVDRFAAVISVTTRHAPLLDQAILCDFISEGHYGRHLRRMREVYAERFSILMEESQRHLHGLLELDNIEAGLQTVGWLRKGLNAETVAQASAKHGIDVTPVSRYAQRPLAREGLQLGFAAVNPREIRRGIKELATAINTLL